jgi:hypothetical protein
LAVPDKLASPGLTDSSGLTKLRRNTELTKPNPGYWTNEARRRCV